MLLIFTSIWLSLYFSMINYHKIKLFWREKIWIFYCYQSLFNFKIDVFYLVTETINCTDLFLRQNCNTIISYIHKKVYVYIIFFIIKHLQNNIDVNLWACLVISYQCIVTIFNIKILNYPLTSQEKRHKCTRILLLIQRQNFVDFHKILY
jgi:hypothetical protein